MSASANEALVLKAIEAIWNRGDLDAADALFAPAYLNHYGLITDLVPGPEAIKISAAIYRLAFPGLHVKVEEISTVEDTVVLRWTASATLSGASTTTTAPEVLTGITRSRIAAGKIIETWTDWDRVGVLRKLGIPTE
jgi:hypothetical protein